MTAFEDAWKRKEALGYRYGKPELEGVELGWKMAVEAAAEVADKMAEEGRKEHSPVHEGIALAIAFDIRLLS